MNTDTDPTSFVHTYDDAPCTESDEPGTCACGFAGHHIYA